MQVGGYATGSKVILDGFCALLARDKAVEKWLQAQVLRHMMLSRQSPLRAVRADHVRDRLAVEHAKQ